MADCEQCAALRAEVASLTIDLQHAYGEVNFQIDKVTIHGEAIARLTDEVEKLNEAMEMLLTDVRRTDLDMRDLKTENEKLRAALDEAQREITQLYEDAAGESI